jgi:GNAT superfamily N-acetyltransferase/L-amino acid N-acyltransferase YncA
MNDMLESVTLSNGAEMHIEAHEAPLPSEQRTTLIDLIQHAFPRTDVDWLQSMRGVYADVLDIHSLIGSVDGVPVATASVSFPSSAMEVCVITDVMTLSEFRGLGIARILTEQAVQIAFAAGCHVAYLGNAPTRSSVYEKIGFKRISGVFMRRAAPGHEEYESEAFAPGQPATIRETTWGDLPGIVCLMAQPMESVLAHYDQGLASTGCVPAARGVSNFTSVKYETESRGGTMLSLVGETPQRILGFATATPGPGALRAKTARLDAAICDAYPDQGPILVKALLDWLQTKGISLAEAAIAEEDTRKRGWFESEGFAPVARIPDALHHHDEWTGVQVLHKRFAP